ncbi:nitroreductase family protein [Alloscardovia theropitheci]|nr:nitroreductase family protein [Alloscardovia theropitheci]
MSTTHSQVIDAIDVRVSSRSFTSDLIEDGIIHQLRQNIDAMSLLSGVNFTLLENHPEIFSHTVQNYGIFEGAAHVIVLSGDANDYESIEKAGFYGERLVLTATLMGLATCWVDNSIDMDLTASIAHIDPSHTVFAAIAVGYFHNQKDVLEQSFDERENYQREHRTSLPLSELSLSELSDDTPSWYRRAQQRLPLLTINSQFDCILMEIIP